LECQNFDRDLATFIIKVITNICYVEFVNPLTYQQCLLEQEDFCILIGVILASFLGV